MKIKLLSILILSVCVAPLGAGSIADAIQNGTPSIDFRLRYESVDQDGKPEDAAAKTIRLRLGYTTGEFNHFQFHVDVETIQNLFDDNYNSTNNGRTEYPVVADPIGSELNQAYLAYKGLGHSLIKIGRQRIILDNARFVGNVGWRQNEQTYDAYTFVFKGIENGTLTLTNIQRVNRIFGEYHQNPTNANFDTNALIGHYLQKFGIGDLAFYGHFLEFQNPALVGLSHQNLGIRFSGKKAKFSYTLEYAKQSDFKDGNPDIDTDYSLVELGFGPRNVSFKVGYELLGGDGNTAFMTPLATLHAFNGWADVFLNTPAAGLRDLYGDLSANVQAGSIPLVCKVVYHQFESDIDGIDYGSEFDALVKAVLNKQANIVLKFASYEADAYGVDLTKFWLMGQYKF